MAKNALLIVVDPGFDATKVIINGETYIYERDILDITGRSEALGGSRNPSYLVSYYIPGKKYYVGEYARLQAVSKLSNASKEEDELSRRIQQSEEYLLSSECKISMMSAVGAALVDYKKNVKKTLNIEDLDRDNIVVFGVALPHSSVDKLQSAFLDNICKKHQFDIENVDGRHTVSFTITPNSVLVASQAMCAFVSVIADDECAYYRDEDGILANLPALIIDGGYRTVGIFQFSEGELEESAMSYTEFSAFVIYDRVAKVIRERYKTQRTITDLVVNNIISKKNGKMKIENDDGVFEAINIMPIYEAEKSAVFNLFIEKLNEEYDLSQINSAVFAGGTGAMYYPDFKEYAQVKWKDCAPALVLTNNEFMGKDTDPVFAIAIGLYKLLHAEYVRALAAATSKAKE